MLFKQSFSYFSSLSEVCDQQLLSVFPSCNPPQSYISNFHYCCFRCFQDNIWYSTVYHYCTVSSQKISCLIKALFILCKGRFQCHSTRVPRQWIESSGAFKWKRNPLRAMKPFITVKDSVNFWYALFNGFWDQIKLIPHILKVFYVDCYQRMKNGIEFRELREV